VVDETKGAKGKGSQLHEYLDKTSALPAKDLRALAAALEYMADLRSQRRFHLLTEETVEAEWLITKPKTTVDVVMWVADQLEIVDYKTGKIPVSPIDNPQLMFYAASHAWRAPKAKGVRVHIVQPWVEDGMQSHWVSTTELADFILRAQEAERKILQKDLTLVPSDKGCMFCPANPHSRGDKGRPLCPAMMQLLYPMKANVAEILAL
jgi:hypothetical protein